MIIYAPTAFSQNVGINTASPHSSALLDLSSNSKGLLIPRLTTAQRTAVATPATGLLVYDSNLNEFYYYDGTIWRALTSSNSGWSITGNAGTVAGTNFLGTTDAQSLVIKTQNVERIRVLPSPFGYVGINQSSPAVNLDVNGKMVVGGTGFSGAMIPAANGVMIQGHTTIGMNFQNATEVFAANALTNERAVNGYSVDSTAAFFKSNTTNASATGAHAAYLYAAGVNGSAAVLHTNASNQAPSLKVLNYGTNSGIYAASYNTSASYYAAQIQQYSTTGNGLQVLMNSASNSTNGVIITHAGTGKGLQVDINNSLNSSDGIRVNHNGSGVGITVNKNAVNGDGMQVIMPATSSADGLEINHNSSNGYGILINRSAINAIGAKINMSNTSAINTSIGFQIQNDSKDPNSRGETIITDSAAGLWIRQGGAIAPSPLDPLQLTIVTGGGLSINTAYPRGSGILSSGVGHGIVAGAWDYDNNGSTDHDGGTFYVRNSTNTNSIAASSVACVIGGTTYKIIGLGSVSTLVADMNNNPRIMAAPETPEILLQDFGRGKLVNGKTHVTLDPIYSRNIYSGPDRPVDVFIQLKGNCNGVYVDNINQYGFDVIELNNGTSNAEFSYFVSARRVNEVIDGVESDNTGRFKPMTNPAFFLGNRPVEKSSH